LKKRQEGSVEEISLTKDANDFKEASDVFKHIFTSNLLRQTALDSFTRTSIVKCLPCSINYVIRSIDI
jgi:ribonucleotide reductase beta subunit family protein with ferritin-like domain